MHPGGIILRAVQRKSVDARVGPSCDGGGMRHMYNNNNIHTHVVYSCKPTNEVPDKAKKYTQTEFQINRTHTHE